jgi:glycosyltransferase involved in cell wall biosynthesis
VKPRVVILDQQTWMGGGQRVLMAALSCISVNYDPLVLLPSEGPLTATLLENGIRAGAFPLGDYSPGRKSMKQMLAFGIRSLYCCAKVAAVIRREHVALVYINGPRCLLAGVLAARITGTPCIFHLHSMISRTPDRLLTNHLVKYVSRIVACSRAVAGSLVRDDARLASRTTVVYNPVAPAMNAPRNRGEKWITLGMVGRITAAKGHHTLLRAISRMADELRSRVRLIVVGAPDRHSTDDLRYAASLKEYAESSSLKGRVQWVGFQDDPLPYFDLIDVLAQPSSTEGLGLSILEALRKGVPVIAFRTGGVPEIIEHGNNGLLVAPGDEDALLEAVEQFVSDRDLRMRLVEGARRNLDDRFSIGRFSAAIGRIVDELCEPSRAKAAV